mmetsp:Transcript_21473/g.52608  ORF Transcript_21473/g.52608 Transcript_21473/m.52608 type:complete len:197 (+) Transcript_21473:497-1087(+)
MLNAFHVSNASSSSCRICNMSFKVPGNIMRHWRNHHEKRQCSNCSMIFPNQRAVKAHYLSAHTDQYTCRICGRVFSQKRYLDGHVKNTHSLVPLYKCQLCFRRFKHKSYLNVHLLIHQEKPFRFKCSVCGNVFIQKSNLKRHRLSSHKLRPDEGPQEDLSPLVNFSKPLEPSVLQEIQTRSAAAESAEKLIINMGL